MTPLVSIGLPCYNRPAKLVRALECLINQTYRNIEIIVSNDCSPYPMIYDICKRYADKDSRIRLFNQPHNLGIYGNYYFVLQQATGSYFMYAQDDDVWNFEYIRLLVEQLERNPEQTFVVSASQYVNGDGTVFKTYRFNEETAFSLVTSEKLPFMWMGLFRTDILRKFDYTPIDIHGKDIAIMLEMLLSYPFGYIDKVLYTKTLYHDKAKQYFYNNPLCLLQMYWYCIYRLITSKNIPTNRKGNLVVIIPLFGSVVMRAYAAQALYLLPVNHPIRKAIRKLFGR